MRVGIGYDAHRLAEGRRLILGGVEIPYHLGLLGHSDADVLCHAVCDALLGAAGAGDLGTHFPDKDPAYKNISSLILLERVMALVEARGLRPVNLDATLVAQRPRLTPYIPRMAANLAAALGLEGDAVNVKATTTEGMGFAGREEGIAAYAVVLLTPDPAEWEPEDTGI